MRGTGKVVLKQPVYAIQEPTLGTYIAFRGAEPRATAELHLATIVPATPACLERLQSLATRKLVGIPHELVRVDRL